MIRKMNFLSSFILALTMTSSAWAYSVDYKQAGHFKGGERLCAETLNSKFQTMLSEYPNLEGYVNDVQVRRVDGKMRFLNHTIGRVARGLSRGMADDQNAQMLSVQNKGEANWHNDGIDFQLTYIYQPPTGKNDAVCDFNITMAQARTFLSEASRRPQVYKDSIKQAIKMADKVRDVLKEFNKNGIGQEVVTADFQSDPRMLDILDRKGSYVVNQARTNWFNALANDGAAASGDASTR